MYIASPQQILRNPTGYVVPNDLTLAGYDKNLWAPQDMSDYANHGTSMVRILPPNHGHLLISLSMGNLLY